MICLLGGTFDPVHNGHLHAARTVAARLGCPVRLVLSARPPHRPPPLASVTHRWAMLKAACAPWPELIADDMEMYRPEPSYTVATLARIRRRYPDKPVFWIIGVDAFCAIHSWHQWRRVFEFANLLLLSRPGTALDHGSRALYESHKLETLSSDPQGGILKLEAIMLNVSATAVRGAIAAGGAVANLLPGSVEAYIRRRKLYATGN